MKNNNGRVALLSILNVIRSLVLIATAYISKMFVDCYDFEANILAENWWIYCIIFVSLIIVGIVLHYLYLMLRTRFSTHVEINLRQEVFSKILRKNVNTLKDYHSGEITNIYLADVSHVRNGICFLIPDIVLHSSKFLFSLIFIVIIEPILLLVLFIFGLLCVGGAIIYSKMVKKIQKKAIESDGKVNAFMQESYQNLKYIQAMDSVDNVAKKSRSLADINHSIKNKRNDLLVFGSTGLYILVRVSYLITIVYSVLFASISAGDIVSLTQVVGYFEGPLSMASSLLNQYQEYRVSKERIDALLKLEDDIEQLDMNDFDEIIFENVSFSYVKDEPILENLSFTIKKNETVLIKGPSGKGKTTIFKLLLGFIKPDSGKISVKKDDKLYDIANCRNLFAYVPQENILFSGSVKENFNLFINSMSDEEVTDALKFANIDEEINDIHAKLTERGEGLSIGQIQRILLAIAIKKNRSCILLDEFTSSLDKNLEKEIVEKVNSLPNTKIIISHRDIDLVDAKVLNL